MTNPSGKDKKPEYKYFELFYYAGKRWGREHLDELIELRFGKKADISIFQQCGREAFEQSQLGNALSTEPSGPKYHSDKEFAENRFLSGVEDVVSEEAKVRGLL